MVFKNRHRGSREEVEKVKHTYRQKDRRRKKVIKIAYKLSAKGKYIDPYITLRV